MTKEESDRIKKYKLMSNEELTELGLYPLPLTDEGHIDTSRCSREQILVVASKMVNPIRRSA